MQLSTTFRGVTAALLALVLWGSLLPARAQQHAEPLTVGVFVNPPFVIGEDGKYSGMAIELWEKLALELGRRFRYVEYETVRDLVRETAAGNVDVAVTNLTITEARAQRVDFTQPWFDGGMRIMIGTDRGTSFRGIVSGLSDAGFLKAYAWIAFIILVATVILTLFDRRFDESFPKRWRDGFAESFYTVMSVATSGRPPVRKNLFGWIGRIWQGLWLVCGIAVLAYVTSSVTSVMTTLSLTSQIRGPADLVDKQVGVLTGTVEEDFAVEQGFQTRSFPGLDGAVEGLVNGDVAAIIADAPVLEYYAHTHPDLPVNVVGRLFEPDKYGFALPRHSPLARPLTIEVLGAHEHGVIEELRTKYFGAAH
jgi:ABC-type amino acid transport substrate-binding protein